MTTAVTLHNCRSCGATELLDPSGLCVVCYDRAVDKGPVRPYSKDRAAYNRRYYETHREKVAAYKQRYYQAHRQECAAYQRRYYRTHRAERSAYQRQYREAHRKERLV